MADNLVCPQMPILSELLVSLAMTSHTPSAVQEVHEAMAEFGSICLGELQARKFSALLGALMQLAPHTAEAGAQTEEHVEDAEEAEGGDSNSQSIQPVEALAPQVHLPFQFAIEQSLVEGLSLVCDMEAGSPPMPQPDRVSGVDDSPAEPKPLIPIGDAAVMAVPLGDLQSGPLLMTSEAQQPEEVYTVAAASFVLEQHTASSPEQPKVTGERPRSPTEASPPDMNHGDTFVVSPFSNEVSDRTRAGLDEAEGVPLDIRREGNAETEALRVEGRGEPGSPIKPGQGQQVLGRKVILGQHEAQASAKVESVRESVSRLADQRPAEAKPVAIIAETGDVPPRAPLASAAAAEPLAGLSLSDEPAAMVSRLASGIEGLILKGREEAVVRLHPPELGELRIRIAAHQGDVMVQMTVQSPAVRDMLAAQLDRLRLSLAESGLGSALLSVQVDARAGNEGGASWYVPLAAGSGRATLGTSQLRADGVDVGSPRILLGRVDCLV